MRTLPLLASALALTAFAACGDDSGSSGSDAPHADSPHGSDGSGSDAAGSDGGGSDGGGSGLTLTGTTIEISAGGQDPHSGVALQAYNAADDSTLGSMVTSDANGAFTITIPTSASGDSVYIKGVTPASGSNTYQDVYLYPAGPVTADETGITFFVISDSTFSLVNGVALLNDNQMASQGWIAALVEDATGAPVDGATVTTTPESPHYYYNSNGLPSKTATSTSTDGIAYITNVTPGALEIDAAKTGATFNGHMLKARAGTITLTIVSE